MAPNQNIIALLCSHRRRAYACTCAKDAPQPVACLLSACDTRLTRPPLLFAIRQPRPPPKSHCSSAVLHQCASSKPLQRRARQGRGHALFRPPSRPPPSNVAAVCTVHLTADALSPVSSLWERLTCHDSGRPRCPPAAAPTAPSRGFSLGRPLARCRPSPK